MGTTKWSSDPVSALQIVDKNWGPPRGDNKMFVRNGWDLCPACEILLDLDSAKKSAKNF